MKTQQTQNRNPNQALGPPEQLGTDTNTNAKQQNESYSLLPTPAVSEWLKTTPTGRPDARASGGEGRESETEQQRSKKKTMKTNKQTKTNKKTAAAQTAAANATDGNTNFVSELKNRTEQLSETETAKTSETETAPKPET